MVKCTGFDTEGDFLDGRGRASLVADTADEVIAMGTTADGVVGLADGTEMTMGSDCFVIADKSLGLLNSSGTWVF